MRAPAYAEARVRRQPSIRTGPLVPAWIASDLFELRNGSRQRQRPRRNVESPLSPTSMTGAPWATQSLPLSSVSFVPVTTRIHPIASFPRGVAPLQRELRPPGIGKNVLFVT